MRYAILAALAASTLACGESPSVTGPDSIGNIDPIAGDVTNAQRTRNLRFDVLGGVQCSDAQVQWSTTNFSTDRRSFVVNWRPLPGVQTYEVKVSYSRDGAVEPRVVALFNTNRTEARLRDSEDGGRYYVVVRVIHNDCGDVEGSWSAPLTIYVGGGSEQGGSQDPPIEPGPPELPPPPPYDGPICHVPNGEGQPSNHENGIGHENHPNDYPGPCNVDYD